MMPLISRLSLIPLAVLCLTQAVAPAHAQTPTEGPPFSLEGFALNRFDVAEVGSDWFSGDSLDFRGDFRPGARLAVDWAHKPLVRYDDAGDELDVVVKNQVYGHLGVAAILAERLRLGANLPVLVLQDGEATESAGQTLSVQDGANLGDLRLSADLRLFGEYRDIISMAIGAQIYVPTGSRDAFTGDEAIRVNPRLMVAGDVGPVAYSVRVGFDYRAQDEGFGPLATGSEVGFVATAGVRALDGKLLIGPELWGTTVVTSGDAAFEKETTPFELLFGGHYRAGDWNVGLGVGPGLNRGIGAPAVRVVSALTFIPNADDRDGDGILDADDACPDLAGPAHDDPARHGCPDRDGDDIIDPQDACPDTPGVPDDDPSKNGCPPSDRDGDDILDEDDACPDVPGVASDDPEKHGCPDRDGDDIIDSEDACPDTPGVFDPDPEKHGCPPDRDGDGIYDDDDACPDEPGVASDDPDKHGCPRDRDGDGIYDVDDACPDEPGVASDDPQKHGCPIAVVEDKQIKIRQRIEFETDRAKIRPESEVVLQAVLQILLDHPEIEKVRVEGHIDNVGRAAYNRRLSQKRAASVVKWLVEHGIDRLRLIAKGYGLTRPIADNSTAVGRQENRRVEFHIVREDERAEDDAQDAADKDDDDEYDPLEGI